MFCFKTFNPSWPSTTMQKRAKTHLENRPCARSQAFAGCSCWSWHSGGVGSGFEWCWACWARGGNPKGRHSGNWGAALTRTSHRTHRTKMSHCHPSNLLQQGSTKSTPTPELMPWSLNHPAHQGKGLMEILTITRVGPRGNQRTVNFWRSHFHLRLWAVLLLRVEFVECSGNAKMVQHLWVIIGLTYGTILPMVGGKKSWLSSRKSAMTGTGLDQIDWWLNSLCCDCFRIGVLFELNTILKIYDNFWGYFSSNDQNTRGCNRFSDHHYSLTLKKHNQFNVTSRQYPTK